MYPRADLGAHLPISPPISPYLPVSPAASLGALRHLPISPHISPYLPPPPAARGGSATARHGDVPVPPLLTGRPPPRPLGALLRKLPGHSCAVNSVSWRPEPPIPRFLAAPPRPPLLSGGRPCIGARPRRTCLPRLPTTTLSAFGGCRHPRFRRLARRRLAVPAPAGPRLRGCEGLSALRSLQLCIVERGAGDLERVAEISKAARGQRLPRWHPAGRLQALCDVRNTAKAKGRNLMAADTRQGRGENSPEPKANVFEEEKL